MCVSKYIDIQYLHILSSIYETMSLFKQILEAWMVSQSMLVLGRQEW